MLKTTMWAFLIGVIISGCSDEDAYRNDANKVALLCPEHLDKEIVDRVDNMEGTIEFHGGLVYVIANVSPEPQNGSWITPLVPCNLGKEFEQEGLKVKFSGFILEIPDDVMTDVFGQPIALIEINTINN